MPFLVDGINEKPPVGAFGRGRGIRMINIAIVEDDDAEAARLEKYIARYGKEHDETFSLKRYKDGLAFLDSYRAEFDIVFMDIMMPHMNGLTAAKRMRLVDENTALVFITNMAQYAINGYEVAASDYILKPVMYDAFAFRFTKVLASARMRAAGHKFLFVKTQKGVVKVDANSIYYVEVIRHMVVYHTVNGNIEAWESLKSVETSLGELLDTRFVRCNNCFLVNLQYIDKIENDVAFVGGEQLKISRSRRKEFINAVTLYLAQGGNG